MIEEMEKFLSGEMHLMFLQWTRVPFPVPMLGSSQLLVTPEILTPLVSKHTYFIGHLQSHVCTPDLTHTLIVHARDHIHIFGIIKIYYL